MQSISTEHREKLGFKAGLFTNDSIKDAEKAPGAALPALTTDLHRGRQAPWCLPRVTAEWLKKDEQFSEGRGSVIPLSHHEHSRGEVIELDSRGGGSEEPGPQARGSA